MKTLRQYLLIGAGCLLSAMSLAQGSFLAQENTAFYYNLLTINGHPLNQESIALDSRGVLAMVNGDPDRRQAKPVPFRVYLRRDGAVVRNGLSGKTSEVYSVQLTDLLPFAHIGDELVVEPIRQTSKTIRRIIKLKSVNWLTWLSRNDGC